MFISAQTPVKSIFFEIFLLCVLCPLAGPHAAMKDLNVKNMSCNASISLSAIDGERDIRNAKRLLLIISTNALNSGMVFESKAMMTKIKAGTLPVLLQSGKFSLEIDSANAQGMKCWALGADGARIEEILLSHKNGKINLDLDTSKLKQATVYFELAGN